MVCFLLVALYKSESKNFFCTNQIAVYMDMLMKSGDSFWVTTSEFIDLLKGAWIGDRVSDSNK